MIIELEIDGNGEIGRFENAQLSFYTTPVAIRIKITPSGSNTLLEPPTDDEIVKGLIGEGDTSTLEPASTEEVRAPIKFAERKEFSHHKPSSSGLIPVTAEDENLKGKLVPLGDDGEAVLASTRRDLDVKVVDRKRVTEMEYKNLKKNVVLQSKTFHAMNEDRVREAITTLVMGEQELLRAVDRENFMLVEIAPRLHILSTDPKNLGSGEFCYEETISIFENPKTLYTNPDHHRESL